MGKVLSSVEGVLRGGHFDLWSDPRECEAEFEIGDYSGMFVDADGMIGRRVRVTVEEIDD